VSDWPWYKCCAQHLGSVGFLLNVRKLSFGINAILMSGWSHIEVNTIQDKTKRSE
jgi:hypothetical protein